MKKIFTLIAIVSAMVAEMNAQDFEWKSVKSSMTEVPENFYEGTTRDDAREYMNYDMMAEGVVYGNIPEADGKFTVLRLNADWDMEDANMTWSEIVESDMMFYYPAKPSDGPKTLTLDVNDEWNEITESYTSGTTYDEVSLNRTMSRFLSDGETRMWNTVALPFALSAEQITAVFGTNAKVVGLDKIEGDTFYFASVDSMEEETLFLVQLGDLEEDLTGITVTNVKMASIYGKYDLEYSLIPTLWKSYVDNMLYDNYVVEDNALVYAKEERVLPATCFYIQPKDGLDMTGRTLTLVIDGEATEIKATNFNAGRIPASVKRLDNGIITIVKEGQTFNAAGQFLK